MAIFRQEYQILDRINKIYKIESDRIYKIESDRIYKTGFIRQD